MKSDIEDLETITGIPDAACESPDILNREFCRIPGYMGFFTALYAGAVGEALSTKADAKARAAELYLQYRRTGTPEGKPVTEGYLAACVEADPSYRALVALRDDAETKRLNAQGVIDSLEMKRDALISIGANLRKEMGALTPQINETPSARRKRANGATE